MTKDPKDMSKREFRKYARDLEEQQGRNVRKQVERDMASFERDAEKDRTNIADDDLDKMIMDELGVSMSELEEVGKLWIGRTDVPDEMPELDKFMREVQSKKYDKAMRRARGKKMKKIAKIAKEKRGFCSLSLVGILAGLTELAWAAHETVSAVASALI